MQIAKFSLVLGGLGMIYAFVILPMLPESMRGGSLAMTIAFGIVVSIVQLYVITRLFGMHV